MSLDFSHLEIYFVHYSAEFTKPADPLVLFVHWAMIQNRFRCITDSQPHHILPSNWLSNDSFYDFQYKKHDVIYRMEIYVANECALIQLKNMESLMDSSQYVKIDDFIDTNNFHSDRKFSKVFKDLNRLYTSLKWSIDRFKIRGNEKGGKETRSESLESIIPSSVSSSQTLLSKKSRRETKKSFSMIFDVLSEKLMKSKPETIREVNTKLYTSTYSEFLNQIKQEKAEFESNVEIYMRNSISSSKSNEVISSSSSNNLLEIAPQKQKKATKKSRSSLRKTNGEDESDADVLRPKINPDDKDNVERDKIKRDLLFDYNPITNYFNFNNKTDKKKIDQKLMEEDEFVKRAYEKFNVKKFCEVKLVDCFSSDLLKGLKVPIKLTDEMKNALKLVNNDDDDQYDDIVVVKKKKKNHKVRKNIWREKKRTKRKKDVKKNPSTGDTSKQDMSIVEQSSDLVNFFKNGTLKRKRSHSSGSSTLPALDDSDPAENSQVINLEEEKEDDPQYKSPIIEKQTLSNDSVAKKLTFSSTVQSSIVISRIEPTLDDTLSINLFPDESQRPSKRTRRESENEEEVQLNNSIEEVEDADNKNETKIESPWKITPLKKRRLTPKTTPLRQIVAKPAGTPSTIEKRLKEISNCTQDNLDECLSPAKFYKNMTSTQINNENYLDKTSSLETFEQNKMINRE